MYSLFLLFLSRLRRDKKDQEFSTVYLQTQTKIRTEILDQKQEQHPKTMTVTAEHEKKTTGKKQLKHETQGYLNTGANKLNKITSHKTHLGKVNQQGKLQNYKHGHRNRAQE